MPQRSVISDDQLRRVLRSDGRVALYGDLVRALVAAIMVVVLYFFAIYLMSLGQGMYAELHMNDFGKFYYSARVFLEGAGTMYGPTPATALPGDDTGTQQLWNMNPPHFHLLILPLAVLSPFPAIVAWALINVAALVVSLWVIGRTLEVRWTPAGVAWTFVAAVACSATGLTVVTGQLTFLLMLPVTLAWREAREGRWSRAAVLLGVAASVKPFLALFALYFVVTKRGAAVAWMVAAGAASVFVGLAVFGWHEYAEWIAVLGRVDWSWLPMNASIHGLVSRSLTDNLVFEPFVHTPAAVLPTVGAVNVLLVVATFLRLRSDTTLEASDRAFAALTLLSLLISPLGWMYYVWLAAGPAAAVFRRLDGSHVGTRGALIALAIPGLLMPIYVTTLWRDHPWGGVTLGSAYAWTLLALWAATVAPSGHANGRTSAQLFP